MNRSEQINELAAALSKAQGEMKGAVKDSANPFFKSKYADLSSVVEAIRVPFSKNGLAYIQNTEPTEGEEVRVETVLMHSSGQWMASTIALPVAKADAQGFGSAITYARRYGLAAMAGVAPEDDDGNAAAKAAPKPGTVSDEAWEALREDEKKEVQAVVDCVIKEYEVKGPAASLDMLREETKHWETEYKAAMVSRFPGKMKTAWNKLDKERKESQLVEA